MIDYLTAAVTNSCGCWACSLLMLHSRFCFGSGCVFFSVTGVLFCAVPRKQTNKMTEKWVGTQKSFPSSSSKTVVTLKGWHGECFECCTSSNNLDWFFFPIIFSVFHKFRFVQNFCSRNRLSSNLPICQLYHTQKRCQNSEEIVTSAHVFMLFVEMCYFVRLWDLAPIFSCERFFRLFCFFNLKNFVQLLVTDNQVSGLY